MRFEREHLHGNLPSAVETACRSDNGYTTHISECERDNELRTLQAEREKLNIAIAKARRKVNYLSEWNDHRSNGVLQAWDKLSRLVDSERMLLAQIFFLEQEENTQISI